MSPTTTPRGASRRRKQVLAGTALAAAATLALAGPIASALAASDGTPVVATSETVKANLKADGSLDVARLFSQIQATGNGHVSLEDPTSTEGLRNLDGWGAPSTSDGKASYDFTVDGTKQFRTVADFTKDLPVSVRITYRLDGKKVAPSDLDGKSGKLAVSYTVKNTSADATPIVYQDGHGKTVTETAQVVTPYVGQLALDLPDSFRDVSSVGDRADQAGDGHGGRLVTWTMVLFEPIGQNTQRFGFTAQVDHLALPTANMQIVPVSPENHPELKFGQDGFQSGAETGQQLTDGATQIDDNVLKLRDGAAQVLDGLTQLQAGAQQLNGGLAAGVPQAVAGGKKLAKGANDAADGATQVAVGNAKLAAGLGDLSDGSVLLQNGARQLNSGAAQLSTAFEDPDSDNDLIDGSQALAGGLGLILSGVKTLPASISQDPAFQQLKGALTTIQAAIGAKSDSPVNPKTLNAAINALEFGLTNTGCDTSHPKDAANPCGFKQILGLLQAELSSPGSGPAGDTSLANLAALNAALGTAGGKEVLEYLYGPNGLDCGQPSPTLGAINPALSQQCTKVSRSVDNTAMAPPALFLTTTEPEVTNNALAGIIAKLGDVSDETTAVGALAALQQAIDAKVGGSYAPGTLFFGLEGIRTGLTNPACSPTNPTNPVNPCGIKEVVGIVSAGIDQLVAGISSSLSAPLTTANDGAGDLADGIAQAGDGAVQLADGASQLSGGIDQLAGQAPTAVSGAEQLAAGSKKLAKGLNNKLAPGAEQLSAGLGDLDAAVTGSAQIADGLGQAQDGQSQVVDGAGQISEQGTSQLVKSGNETASSYGREYAIMKALDRKGATQGMPYGSPKGSSDNRGAYDITIAAVGSQHAMGNTGRGVLGLVVLGLGALGATLIRGRFV